MCVCVCSCVYVVCFALPLIVLSQPLPNNLSSQVFRWRTMNARLKALPQNAWPCHHSPTGCKKFFRLQKVFLTLTIMPMYRVFANGPEDLGSIPGRVIPKTQKMVLDVSLLITQHYKVRSRVKWGNPGKGVAPSNTPCCCSNRKGSLRVTLDYGRQKGDLIYYKIISFF